VRGELSRSIRAHILGREDEWTLEEIMDAMPGVARDAVTSVINTLVVKHKVTRVGSCKSRAGGFAAVYENISDGESAPQAKDEPWVWENLMGGKRYEDIKLKRRT
jgi:hypothetical protein